MRRIWLKTAIKASRPVVFLAAAASGLLASEAVLGVPTLSVTESIFTGVPKDHVCYPSGVTSFYPPEWGCYQSNSRDKDRESLGPTAWQMQSEASVGTLVLGESNVSEGYYHRIRFELNGDPGETAKVSLASELKGTVEANVLALGHAKASISAEISVFQGDYDGWSLSRGGSVISRWWPESSAGDPEPIFESHMALSVNPLFVGFKDDAISEQLLDDIATMVVNDTSTDLWVAIWLRTRAESFAATGGGDAASDVFGSEKYFRYSFALEDEAHAFPVNPSPNPMPEPSSIALLGLGLFGIIFSWYPIKT